MTLLLRLRVRALPDGRTVAVLVSGMSQAGFDMLGERLRPIATAHGARLERQNPRDGEPADLAESERAWLLRDGPPGQLIAVIGEMLGCSLPDASE